MNRVNPALLAHMKRRQQPGKKQSFSYQSFPRTSFLEERECFLEARFSQALDKVLLEDQKNLAIRDWWKRSSGLETVEQWVENYHEHPAGWAALLMIHGIPEITGRLRSKVENFAIYSALFLASAVAGLIAPPDAVVSCIPSLECTIRKRIFFYCLIFGVFAQMLCIALAMAFGNALNEAARDCDVFRMFSPAGKAFMATKKCERAYLSGVASTMIAVLAAVEAYMGSEILVFAMVIAAIACKIHFDTSNALFKSAGIVDYWRKGEHGPDDPYDLAVPVQAFQNQLDSLNKANSEETSTEQDLEGGVKDL